MDTPAQHLDFLRRHGADTTPHGGTALVDHLLGTYEILCSYNAPVRVAVAGLFHSVYGTESFGKQRIPLTLRDEVRVQIGAEAETLAWQFGMMNKASFYESLGHPRSPTVQERFTKEQMQVSPAQFADLCTLTVANWLEQRPRARPEQQYIRKEEFRAMLPLLGNEARSELKFAYGF